MSFTSFSCLFISVGDMGTPTRTRKHIDLPITVLMQPRVEDTSEVEVKMKQIMKMSGLLTINGIVSVVLVVCRYNLLIYLFSEI